MVNHKRKFVFVHIPKAAGVSIYTALAAPRWQQHHDTLMEHADPDNRKGQIDHKPWSPDYFKFTFIRNPWDRMLSAYSYLKLGGRSESDKFDCNIVQSFGSFKQFVHDFDKAEGKFFNRHFLPQSFWFNPRYPYDFVGRFETLNKDFALVADKIGYKGLELPHTNASKHKPYHEHYDADMREIVGKIYANDIERFGYKFK